MAGVTRKCSANPRSEPASADRASVETLSEMWVGEGPTDAATHAGRALERPTIGASLAGDRQKQKPGHGLDGIWAVHRHDASLA